MNALENLRVLDLTDELGGYSTKLLADLGAEVIRVDPPEGGLLERAPYLDQEKKISLFDVFFNQNKKRVTLNLSDSKGRELLAHLWRSSDVVVWSSIDGISDTRWPIIDSLRGNPNQIVCLITPFGLDGPYRHFAASDAVIMALGGFLSISGYPDCPVVPFGEQSYYAASLHAALGIVVASAHRTNGGEGQEISVSAQDAVAHALENAIQYYDLENHIRSRIGDKEPAIGTGVFKCRDGYVFLMAFLHGTPLRWPELVEWLKDEDVEGSEILTDSQWTNLDWVTTDEAKNQFREIFESFSSKIDKLELYEEGQRRGVNICPLNTLSDCADSPQLRSRGFFRNGAVKILGEELEFPGPPFRIDGFEQSAIEAFGPGDHDQEILAPLCQEDTVLNRREGV